MIDTSMLVREKAIQGFAGSVVNRLILAKGSVDEESVLLGDHGDRHCAA